MRFIGRLLPFLAWAWLVLAFVALALGNVFGSILWLIDSLWFAFLAQSYKKREKRILEAQVEAEDALQRKWEREADAK